LEKRNYRTFIILKQDTRGYSFANKEPSGYCKINSYGNKAKVQIYVQDLKLIPREKGYRAFLLANLPEGPKQILIESFYVDEKGKRDINIEVDRGDVGGSGLSIDKFEGVVILTHENSIPLVGFKKEPFPWKINNNEELPKEDEKTEKSFTKEEQVENEEPIKRMSEEIPKENKEDKEDKEEDSKLDEEEPSYFIPDNKWQFPRNEPKKEDFLRKILEGNIRMNPFEKPSEGMEWYRISYEELPLILDYPWRWYSNPYLLVGAKKYNHLLLGQNKELNTYCLGIPDIYYPNMVERAKVFGCSSFLCCRDVKPTTGEYGYWIIELPIRQE